MNEEKTTKEPEEIDLLELVQKVWSKRKTVFKWTAIGALAGLIIGFSIPAEFTTTVKMAPEGMKSGSRAGGMADLAALAGFDLSSGTGADGINLTLYPDVVSSTPFITDLSRIPVQGKKMDSAVTLYDYAAEKMKAPWWGYVAQAPMAVIGWMASLGKDEEEADDGTLNPYRLTPEQEANLTALQSRINVAVDKKTGVITASATMQDPAISAAVADSLVSKLQEYIILYRTEKAKQDYEFTRQLFEDARGKYYEAQQRYAQYADANKNVIRESVRIESDRLRNEQQLAYNVYTNLAQQLEMAKIKVQEQTPLVTVIEPARIPVRKSNTSKLVILIVCAVLGGFGATGAILVKDVFFQKDEAGTKTV